MSTASGPVDPDQLAEAGAATFGLLRGDEVRAARAIADRLRIDPEAGFYASSVHATRVDATLASRELLALSTSAVKRTLPGRRAVKAVVLAKGACGNNWVTPHQDWDYVDERRHRGHVVWCPLVDTGSDDGLLHVIEGSHRWTSHRRGSGSFPLPFQPYNDLLATAGTATEIQAGEAVIYDNALLHYSPPNNGADTRVVLGLVVVPEEAAVIHLHSTDGQTAELFVIDPLFFTAAPFSTRPPVAADEIVPIGCEPFGPGELRAWLGQSAA